MIQYNGKETEKYIYIYYEQVFVKIDAKIAYLFEKVENPIKRK